MSVDPPAAKPTTRRIGRVGQVSCACEWSGASVVIAASAQVQSATLPPTQVGLARLAHRYLRNPGKPGFRGGEGRPGERSERGRGGGATLAPCLSLKPHACSEQAAPPTPDPSPPLASLAGGGEQRGVWARPVLPIDAKTVVVALRIALTPRAPLSRAARPRRGSQTS